MTHPTEEAKAARSPTMAEVRSDTLGGAKPTLPDRIDAALNGRSMLFYDLAGVLWPDQKSWRCSSNGGPPGIAMTLSAALRRGGFHQSYRDAKNPGSRTVHPRTLAKDPQP